MTKLLRLRTLKNILLLIPLIVTPTQCADRSKNTNNALLLFSCLCGNVQQVRSLLKKQASANFICRFRVGPQQPIQEATPVIAAVQSNSPEILKLLLLRDADPNLASPSVRLPPITVACIGGNTDAVRQLLAAQASPNIVDRFGGRPLMAAAENGYLAIVEMLLTANAFVNSQAKTSWGITALTQAAQYGHTSVVECLLQARAYVNKPRAYDQSTPLHRAVLNCAYGVVTKLVEAGAKTNMRDRSGKRPGDYTTDPYMKQLLRGEKGCIQPLGLDLISATQENNIPQMESLLRQKADVNMVLSQCVDSQIQQTTPLCLAVQNNNLVTIKTLVTNNADPNLATPNSGTTPLLIASFYGYTQAAIMLLNAGADPNKANNDGVSPLLGASNTGHTNIVKKLLAAGAQVNQQEKVSGLTSLGQAAQNGDVRIVRSLLKAKANVNQPRLDGTTPLHNAVRNDHPWPTKLLRDARADINAQDDEGKRPIDYATSRGIRHLLLTYVPASDGKA